MKAEGAFSSRLLGRLACLLVACFVALAVMAVIPQEAQAGSLTLNQLQEKYPSGKYWNHNGSSKNNPDGWTSSPCTHKHGNCSYSGACGCNSFDSAIQCKGFALKVAYDSIGSSPRGWSKTTLGNLKPGDVIWYKNTSNGHWIFVTGVSGDTITYGDCNGTGARCQIRWNGEISKSTVAASLRGVYSAPRELVVDSRPALDSNNPIGCIDSVTAGKGTITVRGWAFDPNAKSSSVSIHVYVGGDVGKGEGHVLTANTVRPDVNSNHGTSGNHGFEATFNTSKTGSNEVHIYAINIGAGSDNTKLGSRTVTIASGNPVSCLDSITGGKGNVTVKGWAFDPNALGQSVSIHVYVGAPAGSASGVDNTAILSANLQRTDVNNVYGCGDYHGFRGTVSTGLSGYVDVYVYAINIGAGTGNELVGKQKVYVTPDQEGPSISDLKIENVTPDGFDISCVASDDVGIEKVRFPVWSQFDGQDDIIWHEGELIDGRYVCHVKTSQHEGNRGFYNAHAYAYDKSGNEGFAYANDVLVPQAVASFGGSTYYLADMLYFDSSFTYDKVVSKIENSMGYRLARIDDEEAMSFALNLLAESTNGKTDFWIGSSPESGDAEYLSLNSKSGSVSVLDNDGGAVGCANMGFICEDPNDDRIAPVVSDVQVTDVDETGYTVSCSVFDREGVTRVQFESWTGTNNSGSDGGKDDVVLSDVEIVDGVAALRIDAADHNGEAGMYQTMIHAYDAAGNHAKVSVKDEVTAILVPTAYVSSEFSEYYLYDVSASWTDSSKYAEICGGRLVSISDADENAIVYSLVKSNGSAKAAYWIGANDAANEGSFVWLDESDFGYKNWSSGEPNNGDGVEDYVAMNSADSLWLDYPNEGKGYDWSNMGFIVEVSHESSLSNPFDGVYYEVVLPEGNGYEISTQGDSGNLLEKGESCRFVVIPDDGYRIDRVAANGVELEASDGVYVVSAADKDIEITVEVSEIPREDELVDIAKASVDTIANQSYAGHLLMPEIVVSYDGATLIEGTDYSVSYANNVNVGKAKAVLTGMGAYEGTLEVSFDIVQAENSVKVSDVYDWAEGEEPVLATASASFGEPTLMYATAKDGAYSQAAPTEAGMYYVKAVVAESDNWFAGESDPVEFRILKKVAMPLAKTGLVYNGSEQVGISSGDDYSISGRSSATDAGSYVATVVPAEGCAWEDGTTDRLRIGWTISRAKLTASYAGETVAWGGSPKLAVKVTGFVGGETASTASGYVAPTVAAPDSVEEGGSYELTPAGGQADNYVFEYVSGELVYEAIQDPEDTDKAIAVPAAEAGLSYTGSRQVGVAAGEGYTLSGAASATNAGSYVATAALSDGYVWADGSHDAKQVSWSIAPARLVASYAGESVAWGAAPVLAVSVTGFVGGETAATASGYEAPALSAPASPVQGGSYELVPSGGAADNYVFEYVGGTLAYGFEEKPAKALSDAEVTLSFDSCIYDGSAKTPEVSVVYGGAKLAEGVNYQVAYDSGRTLPGVYYVTVTGKGDYQGVVTRAFAISKRQIAVPEAVSGLVYTGANQVGVESGSGYVLSGTASAKHAGSYVATAALSEGYAWVDGSSEAKSVSWSIAPAKLTASYAGESIAWDEAPKLAVEVTGFVGGETEDTASGYVAPTVSVPGAVLEPGTNYVLAPAGGQADDYSFKYVSGMLKVGSKETVVSMDSAVVTLSETSYVYNGKVRTPSAVVSVDGRTLAEGVDYKLAYDDGRRRSGVYEVTVVGMGSYTGTAAASFEIKDARLTASNVTLSYATAAYDGSVKKPTATVKVNGVAQLKSEYAVTYWNEAKAKQVTPKLVGTYWVKVEAKDSANTTGAVWKKLTVNPKATASLKLTRLDNGFKASWTKRTVQCSGYQVAYKQAGTSAWKYKTVTGYKTNFKSVTGLKDKKSYQVKVRTFKTVNGVRYYSAYTPAKTVKTK